MAIKGWTNAAQVEVLEYWFRGTAKTAATHIGLLKTLPTAGSGAGAVEPTGGAYARVAFAQNTTNWSSASGADPSTIQNATSITFTAATAAWATGTEAILGAGYFTKATIPGTPVPSTSMLAWFTLTATKTIDTADIAHLAAASLTWKLGDSDDSY